MLKEGLAAFGPPRDGFGLRLEVLCGGKECPGQDLDGEGISAGELDEFAKLDSLLRLDLLGLVREGLELGVEVSWLAGHGAASLM